VEKSTAPLFSPTLKKAAAVASGCSVIYSAFMFFKIFRQGFFDFGVPRDRFRNPVFRVDPE
jgi:hypothetical protein